MTTTPARTDVLSLRLDPDTIAQLREIADGIGCTVSDLLRTGVQMVLANPNTVQIVWTAPLHATGPNLTVTAPQPATGTTWVHSCGRSTITRNAGGGPGNCPACGQTGIWSTTITVGGAA